MPDTIRDGRGSGKLAGVDSDQRLLVYAKSAAQQHVISEDNQDAYQVIGIATLAAGTVAALHIKNISSTKIRLVMPNLQFSPKTTRHHIYGIEPNSKGQ